MKRRPSILPSLLTHHTQRSIWEPEEEYMTRYHSSFCQKHSHHRADAKQADARKADAGKADAEPSNAKQAIVEPDAKSGPALGSLKTKMCYNWLTGCTRGKNCIFAHTIEELIQPYYQPANIEKAGVRIDNVDARDLYYVADTIHRINCHNHNEAPTCVLHHQNSIYNKRIAVTMTKASNLPHCIVHCTHCAASKIIPIYRFVLASEHKP
jgi:hypothetical protein